MTAYLVRDVGPIREFRWDIPGATEQNAFLLELAGVEGKVELRQPKDREWPQAGDTVFGEIKKDWNGKYLAKSRKKGKAAA